MLHKFKTENQFSFRALFASQRVKTSNFHVVLGVLRQVAFRTVKANNTDRSYYFSTISVKLPSSYSKHRAFAQVPCKQRLKAVMETDNMLAIF